MEELVVRMSFWAVLAIGGVLAAAAGLATYLQWRGRRRFFRSIVGAPPRIRDSLTLRRPSS